MGKTGAVVEKPPIVVDGTISSEPKEPGEVTKRVIGICNDANINEDCPTLVTECEKEDPERGKGEEVLCSPINDINELIVVACARANIKEQDFCDYYVAGCMQNRFLTPFDECQDMIESTSVASEGTGDYPVEKRVEISWSEKLPGPLKFLSKYLPNRKIKNNYYFSSAKIILLNRFLFRDATGKGATHLKPKRDFKGGLVISRSTDGDANKVSADDIYERCSGLSGQTPEDKELKEDCFFIGDVFNKKADNPLWFSVVKWGAGIGGGLLFLGVAFGAVVTVFAVVTTNVLRTVGIAAPALLIGRIAQTIKKLSHPPEPGPMGYSA